jgi:hypothetical protein
MQVIQNNRRRWAMRLAMIAAVAGAAVLAGCAEGPYYGAPAYGYGYGYGPDYFSFYYRSGDGGHRWDGWHGSSTASASSHTGQRSTQAQPRSSSRTAVTQPRVRSSSQVAHASPHIEHHAAAARSPKRIASERTGPDREHGG